MERAISRATDSLIQDPPSSNGHKDGKQTPTHDELRDRWLGTNPQIAHGLGGWQRYAPGIWQPAEELEVKGGIAEVLEGAKPEGIKPTAATLSSVTELTRVKVHVPETRWNADPDILVCEDCVLHIPSRRTSEHDPDYYATSAVPYTYDPDAIAPMWVDFLKHTVPEAQDFLQEFYGYALTTDTSLEIALWLYGPPGSGKSTALAGAMAMLGAQEPECSDSLKLCATGSPSRACRARRWWWLPSSPRAS